MKPKDLDLFLISTYLNNCLNQCELNKRYNAFLKFKERFTVKYPGKLWFFTHGKKLLFLDFSKIQK